MTTNDILDPRFRPASFNDKQWHYWRLCILRCQRLLSPFRVGFGRTLPAWREDGYETT